MDFLITAWSQDIDKMPSYKWHCAKKKHTNKTQHWTWEQRKYSSTLLVTYPSEIIQKKSKSHKHKDAQ